MRPIALLTALALPALAACGRAPAPATRSSPSGGAPAPSVAVQPVVYGEDGSTEWFAFPDEAVRLQTRDSVAAMVPWSSVFTGDEGQVALGYYGSLGATNNLCADQRFWDQPTSASCSGTLIDGDLLLTAGHCVTDLADCAEYAWVFDYFYEADGQRAPLTTDALYHCVDIIVSSQHDLAWGLDLAVLQLDRPVTGRVPAVVAPPGPVAQGDPLLLPGFPSGIPLKIDGGGLVANPRAAQGDWFVAAIDAFHGNSGSGVLDGALRVVGVLSDGAEDYEYLDSCAVVKILDPDDAEESVIYAHHAVTAMCDKGFPSAALCGTEGACPDGFCTGGEDHESCPDDCDGLFAVPPEWACNPAYFGADDGCDCGCGVVDPDCDGPGQVYNCAPGSACSPDGTCETPLPEGWSCNPGAYDSGGACDCDCGAYDPDCDGLGPTHNCAPGGTCREDGTCTVSIPEAWSCRRRWYDADDGCDCDCGAYDPDCDDSHQHVYNCAPGSACLSDGSCEVGLPEGWVCDADTFGADDGCDCNCGARDPDCDLPGAGALNCAAGLVCGSAGGCVEPGTEPVEPGPEPGPEPDPEPVVEPAAEPVAEPVADVVEAEDEPDTGSSVPLLDTVGANGVEAQRITGNDAGGCAGGGAPTAPPLALLGALAWLRRRRAGARA